MLATPFCNNWGQTPFNSCSLNTGFQELNGVCPQLFLSMRQSAPDTREWNVFIGTYTGPKSKGIYGYRFAPNGKLTPMSIGETGNPSFLSVHPNQHFLYAANENNNGTVSSFRVNPDGALTTLALLNTVSSKGSGPCHIEFDRTGKWLFVANYNNGSIAVLPVKEDGMLGEPATSIQHAGSSVDRQRQAHRAQTVQRLAGLAAFVE